MPGPTYGVSLPADAIERVDLAGQTAKRIARLVLYDAGLDEEAVDANLDLCAPGPRRADRRRPAPGLRLAGRPHGRGGGHLPRRRHGPRRGRRSVAIASGRVERARRAAADAVIVPLDELPAVLESF